VDITASVRSDQKCERQEHVVIRDRQRLQKTRYLERQTQRATIDVYLMNKDVRHLESVTCEQPVVVLQCLEYV